MNEILKGLNAEQRLAATHIDGPLLILAGAGAGKTLTITTRLAYLISIGIPPNSILTLTFTNKAASHMRHKAYEKLANFPDLSHGMRPLLCTFHKFGLLFLRNHINRLGFDNNFTVIDSDDKKKILKNFLANSKLSPASVSNYISNCKNEGLGVSELKLMPQSCDLERKMLVIFEEYEQYLRGQNLLDFDDLLLLPLRILESDADFSKQISKQYAYIMIDEYQDTNTLQSRLVLKLCKAHQNLCVVGDDDQSIYAFRGAKIENILGFKDDFSKVRMIKLEKNYRSVGNVLDLANKLIANNSKRLGKKLICTKEAGEEPFFMSFDDEKCEAKFIAKEIKSLLKKGEAGSEIAILYRVNALSRALEEGLMKENIPFTLLSGTRFYEREEIKDIISYLRLVVNKHDDLSFMRVINKPRRGIGLSSLEKIKQAANGASMFASLEANSHLIGTSKGRQNAKDFIQLFSDLNDSSSLEDLIIQLEAKVGLKPFYKEHPQGEDKLANIDEFYANFKDKASEFATLVDLLNEISLLSNQDEVESESVLMMSIHAAKGLEFDNVFIAGLEESFFPIMADDVDLQEERRLCYVAITRAKKRIYLCDAKSRFYHGQRAYLRKSRFLGELSSDESVSFPKDRAFKPGDLVKHKIFGIGRVKGLDKDKISVNFGGIERVILASFLSGV